MEESKEKTGPPEFLPEYWWAFMTLALYKIGGVEAISLERLEQFDFKDDLPEVIYDHDRKVFVMKLKDKDMPAKPVIVPVGGKILKRQRKLIKGFLS